MVFRAGVDSHREDVAMSKRRPSGTPSIVDAFASAAKRAKSSDSAPTSRSVESAPDFDVVSSVDSEVVAPSAAPTGSSASSASVSELSSVLVSQCHQNVRSLQAIKSSEIEQ